MFYLDIKGTVCDIIIAGPLSQRVPGKPHVMPPCSVAVLAVCAVVHSCTAVLLACEKTSSCLLCKQQDLHPLHAMEVMSCSLPKTLCPPP